MSKKVIVSVLLTALFILLFILLLSAGLKRRSRDAGSSAELIPDQTQIVIVPSEMPSRISLQVPPGFTETASEYYEKYYVKNDASIIITGEKITITGALLEDYVSDIKAQYERTADAWQLQQEEMRTINGVPCVILEFTYAIIGDNVRQDMGCTTAVMLKDDRAYIVTCKSRAETYAAYVAQFRSAISSIVIADADPAGSSEPLLTPELTPEQTQSVPAAAQAANP